MVQLLVHGLQRLRPDKFNFKAYQGVAWDDSPLKTKLAAFRMLLAVSMVVIATQLVLVSRVCVLLLSVYASPVNLYTIIALVVDLMVRGGEHNGEIEGTGHENGGILGVLVAYALVTAAPSVFTFLADPLSASVGILTSFIGLMLSGAIWSINWWWMSLFFISTCMLIYLLSFARIGDYTAVGLALTTGVLEYIAHGPGGTSSLVINTVLATLVSTQSFNTAALKSIIHELVSHKDTRAIFQFLLLNAGFMVVQLIYSFRSGSLGLFSDSLHMALDCSSLALGLVAGVLSKTPIDKNSKFPFGYSRFETLAGFTNGTLLVGISGGIIFEAMSRLYNPVALKETTELVVVSVVGLLVNLVGIVAFGHGDHGHGHGHSHSHETSHEGHSHASSHSEAHGHSHSIMPSIENDNMRGIFLHILADTLGSVGVVISTILTKLFKWEGFDPIASIIIAILIFLSAIPLIKSTSSSLLLSVSKDKEAKIRSTLKEVQVVKGVKSFTTPRFWPENEKITGYVHVQVYRGENSAYLKQQCKKLFEEAGIEVMIQMEYDYDDCWCR